MLSSSSNPPELGNALLNIPAKSNSHLLRVSYPASTTTRTGVVSLLIMHRVMATVKLLLAAFSPWWMSGVANPASDVIIVMGDDPDGSGGGYHRPQRKRVRTTKVLEMEQQNGDMEWQEEGETSEGAPGQNRARKQAAPKSAGGMVEAVQSLKQLLEQDLNKKIEAMKTEFQLEFTKLSDRMAEEVARATAQMAQELSQVRDQLTQ
ncbi:hypothetical protein FBEOM_5705, partial [Fusarium beomiforme]